MPGDRIDSLARALSRPMPRRSMLRVSAGVLAGAAVGPGALARTALAQNGRPRSCQEYCASGTPCPGEKPLCCCVDSSETQGAYVVPLGGACYDPARSLCCPTTRADGSRSVVYCDTRRHACGGGASNCTCLIDCAGKCCDVDSRCAKRRGVCLLPCKPGWAGDEDVCCPPPLVPNGQGSCSCPGGHKCGGGCCPDGFTCASATLFGVLTGSACVGPPKADADREFKLPVRSPFGPLSFGAGASAAGARPARAARFGVAMSAVTLQGIAAYALFVAPQSSRAFRRRVRVPRAAVSVTGLPAGARAALTEALRAEALANAHLLAAARARGRSLGALEAGSRRFAVRQSADSGRMAGRAARAYAGVPAKRAAAARALRAAGAAEITVTAQQVVTRRGQLARALPADLSGALVALGLDGGDRRRARARIAEVTPSAVAGPTLLAPLEDPAAAAAYTALAKDLRAYAGQVRRRPLRRRSPGRPASKPRETA